MDLYRKAWSSDESARRYERSRPGYAPASIAFLQTTLGIVPGANILDVGAGTGKLTRQLVASGATITAIEPLAEMRNQFGALLPGVRILGERAEELPVADHAFDAVVSGQAWHWFDPWRAAAEAARVLRPGGGLALLWNEHDERVQWVRELDDLRRDAHAKSPDHSRMDWARPLSTANGWRELQVRRDPHAQRISPEALIERVLSSSVFAVLEADEQREVADEVYSILDRHPETRGQSMLELPYVTELYWTFRRPPAQFP